MENYYTTWLRDSLRKACADGQKVPDFCSLSLPPYLDLVYLREHFSIDATDSGCYDVCTIVL